MWATCAIAGESSRGGGGGGAAAAAESRHLVTKTSWRFMRSLANLGAAAGYHLSRSGSEEAGGAPSAVVVPTLAPTEDGRGGTIGVVGMF